MDVSIIIPTLNRAALLETTLKSIVAQRETVPEYEVIVVDNGSTDNTKEICRKYKSQFQHFTYCYDDFPGQLTGRHKGLTIAAGEMLCYLDDDVELNSGWVNAIWQLAQQYPEITIFGGPSLPAYSIEPPSWLNGFWETTPYGGKMCLPLSLIDLETDHLLIDAIYVFGLNFSIRKKALQDLRGFHPDCIPSRFQHYQGDGETGLAIKAGMKGKKAIHSSRLSLNHYVSAERLSPAYFEKWYYYNGVCQSFTDLRYTHNLYSKVSFGNRIDAEHPKANGIMKRITERIKRSIKSTPDTLISNMRESYHAGYKFHQAAFLQDNKVREWVLKPDYLDYIFPE